MTLFYYNSKDQHVISALDLGPLSSIQTVQLNQVLDWMEEKAGLLDNRYKCMVIANSFEYEYEDGERFIRFK